MKLIKQPETETEYWEAIESLGGYIWQTNHDLSRGRYEATKEILKPLKSALVLQKRLAVKLCEKFGVIHPKDCPKVEVGQTPPPAPEGKSYYWDWYQRMKQEVYRKQYEGIICSACPLSKGLDHMISRGGKVPCGVCNGIIYRLHAPHQCAMINGGGHWTVEILHARITNMGGEEALEKFLSKEAELKGVSEKKPQ